jgi:hypothetical protein
VVDREASASARRDPQGTQPRSGLHGERGTTRIDDNVVAKVAGIAALEVEGIQMGSGSARAVEGVLG